MGSLRLGLRAFSKLPEPHSFQVGAVQRHGGMEFKEDISCVSSIQLSGSGFQSCRALHAGQFVARACSILPIFLAALFDHG